MPPRPERANLIREARLARDLSIREAAARLDTSASLDSRVRLWKRWEQGVVQPGRHYRRQLVDMFDIPEKSLSDCATALSPPWPQGSVHLGALHVEPPEVGGPTQGHRVAPLEKAAEQGVSSDSVRRRTLVGGVVAAPVAGGISAALESVRGGLMRYIAADAESGRDDWDEVSWEYGQAYFYAAPEALVVELLADCSQLQKDLERTAGGPRHRGLLRAVAQLAALTAMSLVNLGYTLAARRWWQTARRAADASGDTYLRVWTRSEDAIRKVYTSRSPKAAIDLADEALAIGGDRYGGQALAGKAQAFALMGRSDQARAVVRTIEPVLDRMDPGVVNDRSTVYGWPESCMRHAESFVYSYIGDSSAATAAREQAVAQYGPAARRSLTLVRLHEALCLVHDGYVADGIEHAIQAISSLDHPQRTTMVAHLGQRVVKTIPERERAGTSIADLSELLQASPSVATHVS